MSADPLSRELTCEWLGVRSEDRQRFMGESYRGHLRNWTVQEVREECDRQGVPKVKPPQEHGRD